MQIPVVLKDGQERSVDKEHFQLLLTDQKVIFFKRENGWVVIGRDPLRGKSTPYQGRERRNLELYAKSSWH